MRLNNLQNIIKKTENNIEKLNFNDVKLSKMFKSSYVSFLQDDKKKLEGGPSPINNIIFGKYTSLVYSKKNLITYIPNGHFYIASFLTPLGKELLIYKKELKKIWPIFSNEQACQFKESSQVDVEEKLEKKCKTLKLDVDYKNLSKFLTNYDWWLGKKEISRQDFYISPLLKAAKILDKSQCYIPNIVDTFINYNTLYQIIKSDSELIQLQTYGGFNK